MIGWDRFPVRLLETLGIPLSFALLPLLLASQFPEAPITWQQQAEHGSVVIIAIVLSATAIALTASVSTGGNHRDWQLLIVTMGAVVLVMAVSLYTWTIDHADQRFAATNKGALSKIDPFHPFPTSVGRSIFVTSWIILIGSCVLTASATYLSHVVSKGEPA